MRHATNEQSLLEDFAGEVFRDLPGGSVSFDWTNARTLCVFAEPTQWPQVSAGLARVQARAADRGFKVLLRSA